MVDGTHPYVRPLALLMLVPLLGACAHVGEDEFESTIAQVRQEMRQGDEAVEARLGARMDALEDRMDALESDLVALEEEFDVTVERLETAFRVTPPIHFGFDDAALNTRALPALDRFAELVRRHGGETLITVEGFTDPAGSEEYNYRLGLRRANSVRDYLVERAGLASGGIRTLSYGESQPRQVRPGVAGPGTKGWENRRVALVVDYAGAGTATVTDGETQQQGADQGR